MRFKAWCIESILWDAALFLSWVKDKLSFSLWDRIQPSAMKNFVSYYFIADSCLENQQEPGNLT